jgi:hypothetical protein
VHHRFAAAAVVALYSGEASLHRRLADARGQGTVEYVALILLVAGVLAAVVAWARKTGDNGIGAKIVRALKESIDGVGAGK